MGGKLIRDKAGYPRQNNAQYLQQSVPVIMETVRAMSKTPVEQAEPKLAETQQTSLYLHSILLVFSSYTKAC